MRGIPETITLRIDGKPAAYIHALHQTGLYGDTPEAVAEELVKQALRTLQRAGELPDLPDHGGEETKLRTDDEQPPDWPMPPS